MADPERPFMPPDPKGEFRFEVPLLLVNLFVAVARLRDAELEQVLRATSMSLTRYRTLVVVFRLGAGSMSELATVSAMDRTTLTRAVDQLEKDGFVERLGADNDRRKVKIAITQAGEAELEHAGALVNACNRRSLEGIPDETQRAMVRGLQGMLANLGVDNMRKVLGIAEDEPWPPGGQS